MSLATIEAFFQSALKDQDLQAKLKAIQPSDTAAETICSLAKARGFEFSAAELRMGVGKSEGLSDEELGQVTGGVGGVLTSQSCASGALNVSAAINGNATFTSALGGVR
jgi:predicted ribosomally synthesized peptide with nif11-like leader